MSSHAACVMFLAPQRQVSNFFSVGPFLILASLLVSGAASAATGVSVQLGGGFSTLHVKAGATFDQDGGIGMEMRPQINIELSSLNTAFDFFYQGRLGSTFGSFPLSRTGVGMTYYPTGLPLQTMILDSGVTVTQNHFAPFLTGQLTLASLAVTFINSSGQLIPFNGLAVGYQVGGGGEMPLTQTWSLFVQFLLDGTLSGGSTTSGALSYSAISGVMGIAIHP